MDVDLGGIDEDLARRLADRFETIRSSTPDEGGVDVAHAPGTTLSGYRFESLDDLVVNRSCQWLIKGILPAAGMVILYGPPGSGKSFLAIDAALHLACGKNWMGYRTRGRAGVVYVAAEGPQGFRHRAVAARNHLSVPTGTPFAMVAAAPDVGGRGSSDLTALQEAILNQADAGGFRPALIVFDTLSRCIGNLDESSTSDMNLLVRRIGKLGEKLGASVLLVHHSGKDASRGLRGSSTLQGAADAIWSVSRESETDARRLVIEKVKDGADGDIRNFRLTQVDLGRDEDGDPIASCVVERTEGGVPAATATDAASEARYKQRAKAVVSAIYELYEVDSRPAPVDGMVAENGGRFADGRKLRDYLRVMICETSKTEASATKMIQNALKLARESGWITEPAREGIIGLTPDGEALAVSIASAGRDAAVVSAR